MASTNDPFKKFDKKSIGFGSRFRKGGSGGLYAGRWGLDGAIRELRDPQYGEGKNLASGEASKIEKVLADKLKSKNRYSSGLNRYDRMELKHTFEEMRRKGELSYKDIQDAEKIIDKLSE